MTKLYEISNTQTGHSFGRYKAADRKAALDAMARAAGYRDYVHACEVAAVEIGEITVVEADAA